MSESKQNIRQSGLGKSFFVGFLLLCMILFLALGFWQLDRLQWKEQLIASANDRLNAERMDIPSKAAWADLDPDTFDFQKVRMTGQFLDCCEARVFISLPKKRDRYSGPGYWIVTPFELAEGGVVYVNRGFAPQELTLPKAEYARAPQGELTLEGYMRRPERVGSATLEPDLAKQVDWVINPARLNEILFPELEDVAPFYVNLSSPTANDLPQAPDEAALNFTNRHLEYAFTWFGLAALMPILAIFWLIRTRRPRQELAKSKTED
ncbi:SURF1 family protein [Maritalea mediterranea]|uniref:SURF1-like protein n=1 Tax=Maritalea mediterranea TaxID=2909667 RepID=A0ABS9E8L8_9HYPH|nr:SURF1 family protein [Maritalea mediterranea]MCF4097801.1 SURF1 family protein [Maritalea mediterranea]